MINRYDFIVFDCDGVILESNELKTQAFRKSLEGEPEDLVEKLILFHKSNGGVSRYKKFEYYYKSIKKINDHQKEAKLSIDRFAKIVKNEMQTCNFVPGVIDFIKFSKLENKRLFVVSGSDQNELRHIFLKRKISRFFDKIYGSPNDKIFNTNKVLKKIKNNECGLFIGDSKSDYLAAKFFDLDFLFVSQFSEWFDFKNYIDKENQIKNFLNFKSI